MNNENAFKKISSQTIERYSKRYAQLGYDVRTLGWGSKEQQEYRFMQTLSSPYDFEGKTILDIGCGFGDYANFLIEQNIPFGQYIGWDINPDLSAEAKKRYKDNSKVQFETVNLSSLENIQPVADIAVMLGVLNFNLKGQLDNYEYSESMIQKALPLVKELMIVDFLSEYRTSGYPKEEFVFYHNPVKMLEFALLFSENVELKHNYAPIPQKEFMLFIGK
jgi:SAM-dependent methyltransferase